MPSTGSGPLERPGMVPLEGGHSGETWLSSYAGERAVVRIYAGRSAGRGPDAARIDAALLRMAGTLLPVPRVIEARSADPATDTPGLLVTELLPGERLDLLLPTLSGERRFEVARELGVLLGRLGHMVQPRAGLFADPDLRVEPPPPEYADLPAFVESCAGRLSWPGPDLEALRELARNAQSLLDTDTRTCLVHSDFNPKNLLVDPDSLAVTGLLDWEFAHSGGPWTDLGNLLRFDDTAELVAGVLDGLGRMLPDVPDDVVDRARAADLFALVELATRAGENPVADRAAERLSLIVRSGDPHAREHPGGTAL